MPFLPPLADASDFPTPVIRALPITRATGAVRGLRRSGHHLLLYAKARHAFFHIALAVPARRVWLPAYHCPALVEPFLAAGKDVQFYPHRTDLSPRIDYLQVAVERDDLVVAVRYFGFDCGVTELAGLCRRKGCFLVEDLAHAALTERFHGVMAVTSLVKFYPVNAGAELWFSEDSGDFSAYRSSCYSSLKTLHDALPGPRLQTLKKIRNKITDRLFGAPVSDYRYFDRRDLNRCLSKQDGRYLAQRPDAAVCKQRRHNYLMLTEMLSGSSWGQVFFEQLPDHVTPYVLPFLLTRQEGFARLRGQAIQVYRWEEMVPGQCQVSLDYRKRLVHLPCHQDLDTKQLETIAEVLR